MLIADRATFSRERRKSTELAPKFLSNRVALLLAGGDGVRLQELTNAIAGAPIPKQYCPLWEGSSLLQTAIFRTHLFFPYNNISVIINADHEELARDQLSTLPEANIIIQPSNRETGPGMLYALFNMEQRHPNAIAAVFPTDHYIDDDLAFIRHVNKAFGIIAKYPEKIAMLGISPDRPETEYGYIVPSTPIFPGSNVFNVGEFAEKPNAAEAETIITRGGLWNTFVMVFQISRMLELLRELVPDQFETMSMLRYSPAKAAEVYQNISPWNISKQVITRIPQHLLVVKTCDVRWSDWGSRESIERTYRTLNLAPFWNRWNNRPVTTEVPVSAPAFLMASK